MNRWPTEPVAPRTPDQEISTYIIVISEKEKKIKDIPHFLLVVGDDMLFSITMSSTSRPTCVSSQLLPSRCIDGNEKA